MKSVLLLLFMLTIKLSTAQEYNVSILSESSIAIKGNSNINKFAFNYENALKLNSNAIKAELSKNTLSIKNGKLDAEVVGFKSGNKLMDRDYRNMMNYSVYPNISIAIQQIIFIKKNADNGTALALANLTIAGENRLDTLKFSYSKSKGIYRCISSHELSLRDYKIKPIKKMMGLIALKDQLAIDMIIYLKID